MSGRSSVAAALVAAALFFLPAGSPASQAHVLRFTEGTGATTLNPFLAASASVQTISQLTMAHFVRFGPHGEFIPELITTIPSQHNGGVSADGKTITYHLRHGVRWSDGAPFDADDVAYTVRVAKDTTNLITQRDAWTRITSVDEPDKFTVVFHLNAPYLPFVVNFFSSNVFACVLPRHVLGPGTNINQAPYNGLPVGIGPFRYTAFRRGDEVDLEADPYYFGKHPKLEKIVDKLVTSGNTIFNELTAGQIDLWSTADANFVERLRANPALHVSTTLSPFVSGIYLQTTHPITGDPAVRRALRLATDRKALFAIAARGLGVLSESIVPPVARDFAALPRAPFDPAQAGRELDAAGWKLGGDGIREKNGTKLSLTLALPAGYAPSATAGLQLQQQWKSAGIDLQLKSSDIALYFAPASAGGILENGNFDAALLSFDTGVFADLGNSYSCAARAPRGLNLTRYCNPHVDSQAAAYEQTLDPARRAALARDFQSEIDRDCPVIVMYVRSFAFAASTAVTNFKPQTFGMYDAMVDTDVSGR